MSEICMFPKKYEYNINILGEKCLFDIIINSILNMYTIILWVDVRYLQHT